MNNSLQSYYNKPSDQELDVLEDLLDGMPGAMNIEMMDGFLTALVCSPELVMPGTYMHYTLGEEHEFETAEQGQKFAELILRHWNSIVSQLEKSEFFYPVLLESEDGSMGNDWAAGFLSGMHLGGDDWKEYLNDEEKSGVFVPILMLAYEHNPDPELRPDPIDAEKRERLLAFLTVSVPMMYAHFAQHRKSNALSHQQAGTFQRSSRKIGRNEPCPCGSNWKYKKCCGKN